MTGRNDGGPAFPIHTGVVLELGMSLRDWFAGQALIGLIGSSSPIILDPEGGHVVALSPHATFAFALADAMLTERSKP